MESSLKSTAVKGFGWSAVEKFSVQGMTFILQMVLARLLAPGDYGIIGMLAVFMQIAQVLVDTGLANALIQRKECTQEDYSTVFYYNLFVSAFIFWLFFIIAPFVANFYRTEELVSVMRVISITIVLNAIPIVNRTILVREVDFKTISKVSFMCVSLSGAVGICMAYCGLGVWALCFQTVSNSLFQCICFKLLKPWKPSLVFSRDSFGYLFNFGSKMLITNLIGVLYTNMYTIVIGKRFSKQSLGYYSRADQFASFPASSFVNIVTRVVYPIFCRIQDDDVQLRNAYRKIIRLTSFIIFPVMIGLMAVAKPFIYVFLTDKWDGAVVLLQILCLDWILDHLTTINLNLLYVKGRTDLALKLEIIKKAIAVTILCITLRYGIEAMCWGRAVYSVIATVINTTYTKRFISLGIIDQLIDILPYLIGALFMGGIVYLCISFISASIIQLIVGVSSGLAVYALISFLFFRETVSEFSLIKNAVHK